MVKLLIFTCFAEPWKNGVITKTVKALSENRTLLCSSAVRAFETAPCILDHRRVVSGRSWTCCLTYCKQAGRLLRLWAGRCKSDFQPDRRPTGPLNGGQARKCLVKILSFSLLQPDLDQYHIPMLFKKILVRIKSTVVHMSTEETSKIQKMLYNDPYSVKSFQRIQRKKET